MIRTAIYTIAAVTIGITGLTYEQGSETPAVGAASLCLIVLGPIVIINGYYHRRELEREAARSLPNATSSIPGRPSSVGRAPTTPNGVSPMRRHRIQRARAEAVALRTLGVHPQRLCPDCRCTAHVLVVRADTVDYACRHCGRIHTINRPVRG